MKNILNKFKTSALVAVVTLAAIFAGRQALAGTPRQDALTLTTGSATLTTNFVPKQTVLTIDRIDVSLAQPASATLTVSRVSDVYLIGTNSSVRVTNSVCSVVIASGVGVTTNIGARAFPNDQLVFGGSVTNTGPRVVIQSVQDP